MGHSNDFDDLRERLHALQPRDTRSRMQTLIRDHARAAFPAPRGIRGWLLARPKSRRITLIGWWVAGSAFTSAAHVLPTRPIVQILDYVLAALFTVLAVVLASVAAAAKRRRARSRRPGVPRLPYVWGTSAAVVGEVCCRLCPVELLAPGEQRKHTCVCHEVAQSMQKGS